MKVLLQFHISVIVLVLSKSSVQNSGRVLSVPCGLGYDDEGWDTNANVPWGVEVKFTEYDDDGNFRSNRTLLGTIISTTQVITEAFHKLRQIKNSSYLYPFDDYTIHVNEETYEVSHVTIHPNFNYQNWQGAVNDFAIFHLKRPLTFSQNLRPICLPNNETMVNQLTAENATIITIGQNLKMPSLKTIRLNFLVWNQELCHEKWDSWFPWDPFEQRFCGYSMGGNANFNCSFKHYGAFAVHENRYYMIGHVNQIFSSNGTCNESALYVFFNFPQKTLTWVNSTIRCGSNQFACSDNQCVPKEALCNGKKECSDGSDEDYKFCQVISFCEPTNEFNCGTFDVCIPNENVCDGVIHCISGIDEELCSKEKQLIAGLIGGSVLLVVIVVITVFGVRRWHAKALSRFGEKELNSFLHGDSAADSKSPDSFPYDPSYEISRDRISFSREEFFQESNNERTKSHCFWKPFHPFKWGSSQQNDSFKKRILGKGEFGTVFHGTLTSSNLIFSKQTQQVAIKTFNGEASADHFKALLSELKIYIYVGQHENIANLIGANTTNIKQRELWIITEFCALGSLDIFLRDHRSRFENKRILLKPNGNNGGGYTRMEEMYQVNLSLFRWSHQIANGMAFLASRDVAHGDLALRNVLLTDTEDVKICDFGLAHKVYGSQPYTLSTSKALKATIPWAWMPLESLRDFKFSPQADVWAYGIVLWEIFSLGSFPNPKYEYGMELFEWLETGHRLSKPQLATLEIYEIMQKCWSNEPEDRPTFSNLVDTFLNLIDQAILTERNHRTSHDSGLDSAVEFTD